MDDPYVWPKHIYNEIITWYVTAIDLIPKQVGAN